MPSRTEGKRGERWAACSRPSPRERKLEAIACYGSQFKDAIRAGEVYPNGEPLLDVVRHQAAHYGTLIRARYGEPFYTNETMLVRDIVGLEVASL